MADKSKVKVKTEDQKQARLAQALRDNLRRRKSQSRARFEANEPVDLQPESTMKAPE